MPSKIYGAYEIEKQFGDIMKKYDITYDDLGNIFICFSKIFSCNFPIEH